MPDLEVLAGRVSGDGQPREGDTLDDLTVGEARRLCERLGCSLEDLLASRPWAPAGATQPATDVRLIVGFGAHSELIAPAAYGQKPRVTVDLESVAFDRPMVSGPVDRLDVWARTFADLSRCSVLDGVLPSVREVRLRILGTACWLPVPVPLTGDEDIWRRDYDVDILERREHPWSLLERWESRREGENGWRLWCTFREPVLLGFVISAVLRSVLGRFEAAANPVSGRTGPTVKQCHLFAGEYAGDVVARTRRDLLQDPVLRDIGTGGRSRGVHVAGMPLASRTAPVDERLVNPIGFARDSMGPLATLVLREGLPGLRGDDGTTRAMPEHGRVSEYDVARNRDLCAVRLPARTQLELSTADDSATCARVAANLAAAGVPLVTDDVASWAPLIGEPLAELAGSVEGDALRDSLRREEHSIRLRRIALRTFGTRSAWHRVVARESTRAATSTSVSVLLVTRRPQNLAFALSQVQHQRGVDVEVIVGLHGIPHEHPAVVAAVAAFEGAVQVVELSSHVSLGEALNLAASRASADFIAKMDDDDWYGPDHLGDLLLARDYSGADLVGCTVEFIYLEAVDRTVRRPDLPSELPSSLTDTGMVTGGSLLIGRAALARAGGFQAVPRFEDGELCVGVRASGGLVYRQHGLNYLYRRQTRPDGHTFQVDIDYYRAAGRPEWNGIFFNDLMRR